MKTTLIIIGIIILLLALFACYRLLIVKKQNLKMKENRFASIKPLYEKLKEGQNLTVSEILPYATNLITREPTYQLLVDYNKTELFPTEFYSIEKSAESNLANWLLFPTELDGCPDQIELVKRVTIKFDNNNVYYYVFKFQISEPHWAAKEGWMLGVVGPYFDDSKPYDFPSGTFSRLSSKFETTSPDEEAKWVHENISMKNK